MIKLVVLSVLLALAVALPKKNVHPQIVGGLEAEPHSIPWQAWITIQTESELELCNGALISSKFVLTSELCLFDSYVKETTITLGAHNVSEKEDTQIQVRAKNLILYKEYHLGLIELETEVPENDAIKYATLSKDTASKGATGRVCGWGQTMIDGEDDHDHSDVLRCMEEEVTSDKECSDSWGLGHNICLRGDNGHLPCFNDDGAPLTVDGKIVGIFGGFCYVQMPSPSDFMQTTTPEFLKWIQDNTGVVV